MTEEQQLRVDLLAKYGETVVKQATELSGLQICLLSLGTDVLTTAERERMYRLAGVHLGKLLETVMPPAVSALVVECALRIDAAADMAMLDDIEKRDGLPPVER